MMEQGACFEGDFDVTAREGYCLTNNLGQATFTCTDFLEFFFVLSACEQVKKIPGLTLP
jgi:hypothetical protein